VFSAYSANPAVSGGLHCGFIFSQGAIMSDANANATISKFLIILIAAIIIFVLAYWVVDIIELSKPAGQ